MQPSYSKSTSSSSNSHGNDKVCKTSKTLDVVSLSQELDYSITETMGQFSPQFDELADSSDHTPLRNPSPITMASSSSKMRDMAIISQLRLYPGNGHLSSGCSLHWRSSPITPLTRLGETKTQDSGCGLYDILEDDTPEIFKESPTPVTSVKSSSPFKKRVSPPHGRIQEFQSSSSAGLKSGRKFVLKSVPSFPPLTPCIDPNRSHPTEKLKKQIFVSDVGYTSFKESTDEAMIRRVNFVPGSDTNLMFLIYKLDI
ncbi:hypothetical protein OIU77_005265 [Salix suchowensis]|uniref:Uncharacterized protein n=1 Tax=Salix suchowensis TaxID=1278906 RepID=A0ABQ9AQU4_9ROSI|nr:hypothetical protein OIU77_005265 [Salix suchowensis]